MILPSGLTLWAVVAAVAANVVIGSYWYSPAGFGRAWMRLVGMAPGAKPSNPGRAMGLMVVVAFFTALVLEWFLAELGVATAKAGAVTAFWIWAGFVATIGSYDYIFTPTPKPWQLYAINVGYQLVAFTVMGGILAAY